MRKVFLIVSCLAFGASLATIIPPVSTTYDTKFGILLGVLSCASSLIELAFFRSKQGH